MRFASLIPLLLWSSQALAAPHPEAEAKAVELEALADAIEGQLHPRQQPTVIDTVAGNVFAARDVCQGRMNGILNDLHNLPLGGQAGASKQAHINQFTQQWSGLRQSLSNIANGLRRLAAAAREGESIPNIPW